MKSDLVRSFSGPYFPAFRLNTERFGVSFPIQSKCGEIRTRKTLSTDTFSRSVYFYLKKCLRVMVFENAILIWKFWFDNIEPWQFFFLSGFSFTDTDDSQDSKGREGTIFYSTIPLSPTHEHWDIYLQHLFDIYVATICMWDGYHVFLIATLVFTTRWDLPPYRINIWLID